MQRNIFSPADGDKLKSNGSDPAADKPQPVDGESAGSTPQLDPTPGTLNAADFLVPVGAVRAETPAVQLEIPVRLPGGKQAVFFMVHPTFCIQVFLLVLDDGEYRADKPFLVSKAVAEQVHDSLIKPRHLYLAQSTTGVLYMVPVAPDADDSWTRSKVQIIELAKNHWLRAVSCKELGVYQPKFIATPHPPADWSKIDLNPPAILARTFPNRIITDLNHKLLHKLAGLACD
ncbi:MAG: hypothetical protein ACYDH9_26620 [Limisphaerales bacterium]